MKKKLLASFRGMMAVLLMLFATNFAPVAAAYAATPSDPTVTPTTTTLTWQGNGPADPGCVAGQEALFHWVLTPGGNADITSSTLTVKYSAGNNDVVNGSTPGNGNGAVQFNTQQAAPAHVTSASVTFTYTGTANNPNLVISDSSCSGNPSTTTVTPVAPTLISNLTCNGNGSYSVPATTGVVYKVNGTTVSGTQTVSTPGTVTVTAFPASASYTLSGQTSFDLVFTSPVNCTTTVTPVSPTIISDLTCNGGGSYTVPTTMGVVYKVNGQTVSGTQTVSTPGTVTVTAEAASAAYTLSGTTSFNLVFHAPTGCTQPVTAGQVTYVDTCGVNHDTYTVPSTANVTYKNASGTVVPAGTYNGSGTVTLTAYANANFTLTSPYSFTHTFDTKPCDTTSVTLCHATGSDKHPYQQITVDAAGAYNGHLGMSHQDGRDIIPPFVFNGQTYSQNWDTAGQAVYNAGCQKNHEHEHHHDHDQKVTLCHATGSQTNPYVQITVSAAGAYDGHYTQHENDIIPTFTYKGHVYQALNWTGENQSIYNNKCKAPHMPMMCPVGTTWQDANHNNKIDEGECKPIPPVDVCPQLPGVQTNPDDCKVTPPVNCTPPQIKDEHGVCVTPGQGGNETPPSTTPPTTTPTTPGSGAGEVLGISTTAAVATPTVAAAASPELANTGDSSLANLIIGFTVIMMTIALTFASRKQYSN